MHSDSGAADESFVDDLAQKAPAHSALPRKLNFEAWHKPRKHWIRINQWGAEARHLIGTLNLKSKGRPLSYASLPGPDLLDVRVLHDTCQGEQVSFRFTGFMSDKSSIHELRLSENEMHGQEGIDPSSHVFPDTLQSVASDKSVGEKNVAEFAPFDVINIDLCGSVAGAPPLDEQRGCYDAILKLVELQKSLRPPNEPWLLFLTTRVDRDKVDPEAARRLFGTLLENCEKHPVVSAATGAHLNLNCDSIKVLMDGGNVKDVSFELAFSAAVSKWVLTLMSDGLPEGTLSLLPTSCVYGVRVRGGRDMLSLGFLCQTVVDPKGDRAALAKSVAKEVPTLSEPDAAAKLVKNISEMFNVDNKLSSTESYREMVVAAGELMKRARFDGEAYAKWAMQQAEVPRERTSATRYDRGQKPRETDFGNKLMAALLAKK